MNACTFHPEVMSFEKCREAFQVLRDKNIKCGIAIKPHVDVNEYVDLLKESDYVCIMSVEPGKGGQSFMPRSIDNMKKVKRIKDELNPRLVIQLDGGVNFEVMKETKQYVDHYVIGSFLMEQINKRAVFDFLKSL
jgi:ribulose-phosphate 3-epimerase